MFEDDGAARHAATSWCGVKYCTAASRSIAAATPVLARWRDDVTPIGRMLGSAVAEVLAKRYKACCRCCRKGRELGVDVKLHVAS